MKKMKLITLGIILIVSCSIQSQVTVRVNIGSPPDWGPIDNTRAGFYYLPDIETYYDVRASQFIYLNNGRWIRTRYLPNPYRNYDLYSGYKVVLNDYHGSRPYSNFKIHKSKYYRGYKGNSKKNIGSNKNSYERENKNQDDNGNYKNNRKNNGGGKKDNNRGHGKD